MTVRISTRQVPAAERLAYFREFTRGLSGAVDVRAAERDVAVSLSLTRLGPVTVVAVTTDRVELEIGRPRRLIQRSDPESYRLLFNVSGRAGVCQAGTEAELRAGQMALYDTSLPLHGWRRPAGAGGRLLMLGVPRALLPVPPDTARRLLAAPIPAGPGSRLLAVALRQVAKDAPAYRTADGARVSGVLVDLLAVAMAGPPAGPASGAPPGLAEAHHRTLVLQVRAFVERHLDDPDLSPGTIAAAHHVSVRTLHRAFQRDGTSLGDHIRHRRLDRCRRDLADPARATQPIRAIAARWGFADHAHLTRAFRAAYGMAPSDFRDLCLGRAVQGGGADRQGPLPEALRP